MTKEIQAEDYVLGICRAVGGERFTLRQVVRRTASEHPEMVQELPSLWAKLMETHRVQAMAEPCGGVYRVVR